MRLTLLGLPAAAVAWASPALAPVVPAVARAIAVPRTLGAGAPVVAVTFDDGPHGSGTPAALERLAAAQAQATFFLVGEQVERRPHLAAAIAGAGHAIGVHGHRHRNLLRVTPGALRRDLDRAAAVIEAASGVRPTLYRPPYGIFSAAAVIEVRRRGWSPVLWSRWGRDWSHRETAASVTARVTRDVGPGDILLLHDADDYSDRGSWRTTIAALPAVLAELRRRDLATVSLPTSVGAGSPGPRRA